MNRNVSFIAAALLFVLMIEGDTIVSAQSPPAAGSPNAMSSAEALADRLKLLSLDEAISQLDDAQKREPTNISIVLLRLDLISRSSKANDITRIEKQMTRLVADIRKHLDHPDMIAKLDETVIRLNGMTFRSVLWESTTSLRREFLNSLEAEYEKKSRPGLLPPMATLHQRMSTDLLLTNRAEAATYLERQAEIFHQRMLDEERCPESIRAWARLMQSRIWLAAGRKESSQVVQLMSETDDELHRAIEAHPDSPELWTDWIATRSAGIRHVRSLDPRRADLLANETITQVRNSAVKENEQVLVALKRFERTNALP